jgi:16S rRNA (cytosine1402-N4)-methyltransferase
MSLYEPKGAVTAVRRKSMTMRSLPTTTDEETSSALFSEYPVSPHSPGLVGRLQMARDFHHTPVLAHQIATLFGDLAPGVVVDATLGGGGHARLILDASPSRRLLGVDRDQSARMAATQDLASFGDRVSIVAGTFGDLDVIVGAHSTFLHGEPIVGVLLDLGVSSEQLDNGARGFSFRADAPLDMRMDNTTGLTAAEYLTTIDQHELSRLLHHHGETRFAGAIARSIKTAEPTTTFELVTAVERAVPPAARRRGHVATRVFQALRVAVNEEEGQLESGVSAAVDLLAPGGLVAVISYHSGEDRAVKAAFHDAATGGCHCSTALGCVCGAVPTLRLLKSSAVLARADEIAANPRARSARLRAGWKLAP